MFAVRELERTHQDMKVDLMIIGAMKCGTTTLADLLKAHPRVSFCRTKEPEFFSKHPDWRSGLDAYHALYEPREGAIYAEASTGTTFYPHFNHGIWNDLYEYNPELKLIYLVRDPIDRIVSHYMHIHERGWSDRAMEDAVRNIPILINNTRYHAQVLPFVERFGRDLVLILGFDELIGDRQGTLERVGRFAGLDPSQFPMQAEVHSNPSIGGSKRHYVHDASPPWAQATGGLTSRWERGLKSLFVRSGGRGFEQRPELSAPWKEAVMRLLENDVLALEELAGRDLRAWFDHAGMKHPSERISGGSA